MGTVRQFCRSPISNPKLLYVVGLAVTSLCLVVAFFLLQSDTTWTKSGDSLHRPLHFNAATDFSLKLYRLENLTIPTGSSSKSSDHFMITVREGRRSMTLNETIEGEVNSVEARAHSPALWSAPQTCEEENCAESLSKDEKLAIIRCENRVAEKLPGHEVQHSTCKFLPAVGRPRVMLVSAEGSGNSWVRGLLEKATGVCTGFCCCDAAMRARGFIGEGVRSGKVLVVKTHDSTPRWRDTKGDPKLCGSAVFLLRNPAHSLIAERNRRMTNAEERRMGLPHNDSHTNAVSKDLFVTEGWSHFSSVYLYQWKVRLTNWVLINDNHPVHVVRYEDLQNDRVKEVEKILDFLHFSYNHDDVVAALEEDYSVFQRPHRHDHFQHYSAEQKENLRTTLLHMIKLASTRGKANLLHLNEYLESLPDID